MLIHGVQVEVNRTSVSEWPNIGQVVLPLSECRLNCSHRGMCMLWTGAPPGKGPQNPRCDCYYGYRSRAIGPAGDFLVGYVLTLGLLYRLYMPLLALPCSVDTSMTKQVNKRASKHVLCLPISCNTRLTGGGLLPHMGRLPIRVLELLQQLQRRRRMPARLLPLPGRALRPRLLAHGGVRAKGAPPGAGRSEGIRL